MGVLTVEFKYLSRKDIARNRAEFPEIKSGATFVVLLPNEPFEKHAVFVYGVDEPRDEFIVLDSVKGRRDSVSIEINGVRKPNQRVEMFTVDPGT